MLCKCGLCHRAVSIYPSVTLVILSKRVIISSDLFTVGYPNHLVFAHQTLWRYADATPLMGASNAGGLGKNCDSRQTAHYRSMTAAAWTTRIYRETQNAQKCKKKNKVGLAKKQREVPCHFSAHFTFYIIIILARYHLPARRHWDVFMILVQDINIQTYLSTYLLTYLLTYHCQYYNEVVQ